MIAIIGQSRRGLDNMSSPNQEYWTMSTYSPEVKKANSLRGIPFIYATEKDEQTAMRLLTGNGFKLWRYLVGNKDGDSFFASGEKIREYTGMTEMEYRGAKDSLKKEGFLVWTEKNRFRFYAKPHEPTIKPTAAQKKRHDEMIADCVQAISGVVYQPHTAQHRPQRVNSFDYDGEPFDF